jgi:transposase-like protein
MGKPGPVKINNYGIEFKLRAVQLSNQPGVLVKDVAESLCMRMGLLHSLVRPRQSRRSMASTTKPEATLFAPS